MYYPFSMRGRVVEIHRFSVTYTEELQRPDETGEIITESVERTDYCHSREQAEALAESRDGTIAELDCTAYEWMDGLEVPDVPDTYAEGVKLYEMGGDTWLSNEKDRLQAENNLALAEYLAAHPITWQDGKQYGVTKDDQVEISLNMQQYQLSKAAGVPAKLEWHTVHKQCREFTYEELTGLALAISAYVYPLVSKNQAYKTKIYGASTAAELKEMVFSYEETT